jgi:hypothetical protein
MNKKKQIFEKIMANIPDIINEELGDELESPKKKLDFKPSYIVDCTYIDKSIMSKLDLFDFFVERMKSGIRIYCKGWQDVIKAISILEQYKAFEREALNGKEYGAVKIYKWRSYMNDSVSEKINEAWYKESIHPKRETPRGYEKREAVQMIKDGKLERDPEVIRQHLLDTGLWDEVSPARFNQDIRFVMDGTEGWDQEMSGDFITEFVYSSDIMDSKGKILSEPAALEAHTQYLVVNGLQVETKQGRYSTKIYIHYDGKKQYEALVKWVMWDLGMVENLHNGGRAGDDRRKAEEIIASGKAPMCF